jgi:hypothetical protein
MFSKVLNPTERGALKDEEENIKLRLFFRKGFFFFIEQKQIEEKIQV